MAPQLADMRGKLLKAGDAAQPKGSAYCKGPPDRLLIVRYACIVPVKPKIKNNQDFTGSNEKVG